MSKRLLKKIVRGAMNATSGVWRPVLRKTAAALSRDMLDTPFARISAQITAVSQETMAAHARLQESVEELELLADLLTRDVIRLRDSLTPAEASRLAELRAADRACASPPTPRSVREMTAMLQGDELGEAPAILAMPSRDWRPASHREAA